MLLPLYTNACKGRQKECTTDNVSLFFYVCKYVDGSKTDTSSHKLVNAKDRGGLWRVKSDVLTTFTFAESYFLSSTR